MELEAAQVAFVGRHRFRPLPARGGDVGFLQTTDDGGGDLRHDFVERVEQRFERALDAIVPDDAAFIGLGERKIDAHF